MSDQIEAAKEQETSYETWAWKWSGMGDHVRASRCMAGCRDSRQLDVYSLGLLRGRIPE